MIDDRTSNNRVQIVLKLSMEIDPKIFNQQQEIDWLQLVEIFSDKFVVKRQNIRY